jgi:hypothetical protein
VTGEAVGAPGSVMLAACGMRYRPRWTPLVIPHTPITIRYTFHVAAVVLWSSPLTSNESR